jgi:hypothetical protein
MSHQTSLALCSKPTTTIPTTPILFLLTQYVKQPLIKIIPYKPRNKYTTTVPTTQLPITHHYKTLTRMPTYRTLVHLILLVESARCSMLHSILLKDLGVPHPRSPSPLPPRPIVYPAACCPGLYLYHNVTQEPIVLVCPFLEPLPGLRLESNWNSMFLLGTHSSCFTVLILGAVARMPYVMVVAWSLQYLIITTRGHIN